MRLAIFDNLAYNAHIQAQVLHRIGDKVELVLDPLDQYAMSDPAWEGLDIVLPTNALTNPDVPPVELPSGIRSSATPPLARRRDTYRRRLSAVRSTHGAGRRALAAAGWTDGLRAADMDADQSSVGLYGASALEAMSCGVPLSIALDRDGLPGRFQTPPPLLYVGSTGEIAEALGRLARDPELRMSVGAGAQAWVQANHGTGLAQRTFEICEAVVSEPRAGR